MLFSVLCGFRVVGFIGHDSYERPGKLPFICRRKAQIKLRRGTSVGIGAPDEGKKTNEVLTTIECFSGFDELPGVPA